MNRAFFDLVETEKRSTRAVMVVLAGAALGATAFFASIGVPGAAAQVRPYTPPEEISGGDWSARIEEILPPEVETRAEARERIAAYVPDPETYPVPRTVWDGKPDFSGVYWPAVNVTPVAVPLESLYRPEVRAYREDGGGAAGLIDWRGIDTPLFHCWPPSPVIGGMTQPVQVVSAPGYLVMINEPIGNFRIISIAPEDGQQRSRSSRPSFQGDAVGHWEGDTLVVEVTRFNGKVWLGDAQPPLQLPQTTSEALRVVERWSRPDGQILDFQVVVEDPEMLTGAWTGPVERRGMLSYDTIQESVCTQDPELESRHLEFAAEEAARRAEAGR